MTLEKEQKPTPVSARDSHQIDTSLVQKALRKAPKKILQLAVSERHDPSVVIDRPSPEKVPITPSCHDAPALHKNDRDHGSITRPPFTEPLNQSPTEMSPTSPTFSRVPTIGESFNDHNSQATEERSEDSASHIGQVNSPMVTRSTTQSIRSVRWRGVLAILAGMFAQMLCWGLITSYGTILAFFIALSAHGHPDQIDTSFCPLAVHLYVRYLIPDTPETLIALAGVIPPFCLLAFSLPWGRLLDAGHHRKLNIAAGILLTSGLIALAFTGKNEYNSGNYWAILLASIPMGIGQSIYFISAPQMAKTWHPNHKGFAMGMTNSGAALGGVVWPLTFGRLVGKVGFREGVAVLAGISALLSIFIAIFAVPAPDFKRHSIKDVCKLRNWWPTRAFRSKVFVVHTISMAFIYLGVLTIPFFIELWARRNKTIGVTEDVRYGNGVDIDRSSKLELYLLITLNACQLPGRLFGSTLCDKFSARKIHAIACFTSAIVIGSFWFTTSSFEGGEVFAALFGLILGVMVSLPINDVQDLLGHSRTHLLGQYAGAVYTCCCPFILAGAVISGALVQVFEVWVSPGAWCLVCFVLGGCGICVGLWMEDDTSCFEEDLQTSLSDQEGSTRCNSNSTITSVGGETLRRKESWSCHDSPV